MIWAKFWPRKNFSNFSKKSITCLSIFFVENFLECMLQFDISIKHTLNTIKQFLRIIFNKNMVGRLFGRFFVVFGRFFLKNIWSPWFFDAWLPRCNLGFKFELTIL
jgi:hypothetical protein